MIIKPCAINSGGFEAILGLLGPTVLDFIWMLIQIFKTSDLPIISQEIPKSFPIKEYDKDSLESRIGKISFELFILNLFLNKGFKGSF